MYTNYAAFIKSVPKYTGKIIDYAIMLTDILLQMPFKYKKENNKEVELNNDDKAVLSLLLASLMIKGPIQVLFQKYDINCIKILNTLTFDSTFFNHIIKEKNEQSINSSKKEKIPKEEIYNNLFKRKLNRIMESQEIILPEVFLAEALIGSLNYKFNCNSDIVCTIFNLLNLDASEHQIFKTLNSEFKTNLESNKNNKVIDDSQNTSFNLPKYISKVGTNLNAENFKTAPAYGRELETKDLMIALMTPETSAILVGEPATGKTAIVENLAYLINKGEVPNALKNKAIIKINVSSLVAGTIFRGSFEEKIERILKEAVENQNIIIFLDEMHTAIGAGSGSSTNIDLANILKPYLDRGKVKIIGATTQEEYEKFILSDEAFKRRFERIDVLEPSEKIVAEILNQRIPVLEKITGVAFPYDSMNIIELTTFLANVTTKKNRNYRDNVNNPDFAIKLLSKAFVLASYENSDIVKPEHIAESIKRSTRLNDAARNRLANLLLTKFAQSQNQYTNQCQIIEFPKRG